MPAYSGDNRSYYAYTPSDNKSEWRLPLRNADGNVDAAIVGAAAAALSPGGFRGQRVSIPSDAVAGVKRKVRAAWKQANPDKEEDEMPDSIKASEVEDWVRADAPPHLLLSDRTETVMLAEGDGMLVALWLKPEDAAKLATTGGGSESEDRLHITVAYLGSMEQFDDLAVIRVIAAIDREVRWRGAPQGRISGWGRFVATESSDGKDVAYASVDIPGLTDLKRCIDGALAEAGVFPSYKHDFVPHVTLAYVDPGEPDPEGSELVDPLTFDAITVMAGDRRTDVPFHKPEIIIAAAEDTTWMDSLPEGVFPVRPLMFFADQEWIPYLPAPGNYHHRVYGRLNLTPEFYDDILRNYDTNLFKQDLPITVEHEKVAGAAGYIKGMRRASDGSIEVKPEWTERGRALIDGDRFRYVSAEFAFKWLDPVSGAWHENVAVGHTLCTRPHFKTDVLKPLAASEAEAFAHDLHPEEEVTMSDRDGNVAPAQQAGAGSQAPQAAAPGPPNPQPAQQAGAINFGDSSPSGMHGLITAAEREELVRVRRLNADLETRVDLADRRVEEAERKTKEMEKERRQEKYFAEVMGRTEQNDLRWLGDTKRHVDHLVSLDEQFGPDSPQVQYVIEEQRAKRRALEGSGIFRSPGGLSLGEQVETTLAEVNHLVKSKREANPDLTEEAAQALVFREDPKLYDRYLNAQG